jgi:hypothetical protein
MARGPIANGGRKVTEQLATRQWQIRIVVIGCRWPINIDRPARARRSDPLDDDAPVGARDDRSSLPELLLDDSDEREPEPCDGVGARLSGSSYATSGTERPLLAHAVVAVERTITSRTSVCDLSDDCTPGIARPSRHRPRGRAALPSGPKRRPRAQANPRLVSRACSTSCARFVVQQKPAEGYLGRPSATARYDRRSLDCPSIDLACPGWHAKPPHHSLEFQPGNRA